MRIIVLLCYLVSLASCIPTKERAPANEYIIFEQQAYFLAATKNNGHLKDYRPVEGIGNILLDNCHKSIQIQYIYPNEEYPFPRDPIKSAEHLVILVKKEQIRQKIKEEIEPTAMKSPDGKSAIIYFSTWFPTGSIEWDHVTAVSKYNTINLNNTSILKSVVFDVRSRGMSTYCNSEVNKNLSKWIKLVANSEFAVMN